MRVRVGLIPLVGMLVLVACGALPGPVNSVATQVAPLAATAQAAATRAPGVAATAAAVAQQAQSAGATAVIAAQGALATAGALATRAPGAVATAEAAAGQVAGTAQAVATRVAPLAPTVGTIAAGALATARAVGTRMPSGVAGITAPIVIPGGTPGPVQITEIQLGLPDTRVTLRNATPASIDIGGWGLRVNDAAARLPDNLQLAPGAALTLHTGVGTSGDGDVYLGEATGALVGNLRPGARIALVDRQGAVVTEAALPALP